MVRNDVKYLLLHLSQKKTEVFLIAEIWREMKCPTVAAAVRPGARAIVALQLPLLEIRYDK